MAPRARTVTGGLVASTVLVACATAALLGAVPATAAETSDREADRGTVEVDFGPDRAGWSAVAGFQVPGGNGVVSWTSTALDAEGTGTLETVAGPLRVYLSDPADPREDPPLDTAELAAYRGETVSWVVDADTYEAEPVGALPQPALPSLDELESGALVALTDSSIEPTEYVSGVAFDLTVGGLQYNPERAGDLDGLSVTSVVYPGPSTIGTSTVAGGAYTQSIPAEFTTGPQTYAAFDSYGRLIASATLEGGSSGGGGVPTPTSTATVPAPTSTATAPTPTSDATTPPATSPVVPTPTSTATPTRSATPTPAPAASGRGGGSLADTGADAAPAVLGGVALLLVGGVAVALSRRRARRGTQA